MLLPQLYRLLKFGIVGSIGMAIDFGLTWLLKEKAGWNRYLANGIGFCAAVAFNFTLNRIWTFRGSEGQVDKQLAFFFAISLAGLGLNTLIVFLATRQGIAFYKAKLLAVLIVFIWNYTANSLITFR